MNNNNKKYFGDYGGRYIPEVLYHAFEELEVAYDKFKDDAEFRAEFNRLLRDFVGRETPLYFAKNLTEKFKGAQIYLKLEGLANTGAHKINNALGQGLLAVKMGKKRVIAETGAGQHGVAVSAAAAMLGLEAEIFMGQVDMERQHPNVLTMRLFGAKVTPVTDGAKTLTDAVNGALKNWTGRVDDTHYILGSALGPHPYPTMVRDFQSVIGREIKAQAEREFGGLPDMLIACVGGGSNSLGMFYPFLGDPVKMVGVEAGGKGSKPGENAIRMSGNGRIGIVQAYRSKFLQDENGSLLPTHSISAGLDYAGIGPQLAHLGDMGRVEYTSATDEEVIAALQLTAQLEGIIPALESSHALSEGFKRAASMNSDKRIVINVSGRGDKDIFITAPIYEKKEWLAFLKSEIVRIEGESK